MARRQADLLAFLQVSYSGVLQVGTPMPYPLPEGTVSLHIRWVASARYNTWLRNFANYPAVRSRWILWLAHCCAVQAMRFKLSHMPPI